MRGSCTPVFFVGEQIECEIRFKCKSSLSSKQTSNAKKTPSTTKVASTAASTGTSMQNANESMFSMLSDTSSASQASLASFAPVNSTGQVNNNINNKNNNNNNRINRNNSSNKSNDETANANKNKNNTMDTNTSTTLAWSCAQIDCHCFIEESRVNLPKDPLRFGGNGVPESNNERSGDNNSNNSGNSDEKYSSNTTSNSNSNSNSSSNEMSAATSFQPNKDRVGISVFSSKPKILFCNLTFAEGQSQSFTFRERLPYDLAPTFRGQFAKYTYKLTIGVQRVGGRSTQMLRLPFRVYSLIDFVDRFIPKHESAFQENEYNLPPPDDNEDEDEKREMQENNRSGSSGKKKRIIGIASSSVIIDGNDEKKNNSNGEVVVGVGNNQNNKERAADDQEKYHDETPKISEDIEAAKVTATNTMIGSLEKLAIQEKHKEKNKKKQTALATTSAPSKNQVVTKVNPFKREEKSEYDKLEYALQIIEDLTVPNKPNSYNVTSADGKIVKITMNKTNFKIGDKLVAFLDFSDAHVACVEYKVTLQSEEIIAEECRKKPNHSPSTITSHVELKEFSLFLKKSDFTMQMPVHLTPTFVSDIISLRWRLHFEFALSKTPIQKIQKSNDPAVSVSWHPPSQVGVDVISWVLPIAIHPFDPFVASDLIYSNLTNANVATSTTTTNTVQAATPSHSANNLTNEKYSLVIV